MLSYCLKCRKNKESKNAKFANTKIGRLMPSSNCAVYGSKKSRFNKEQEYSGILSSLRIWTHLSQIPFVDLLLI